MADFNLWLAAPDPCSSTCGWIGGCARPLLSESLPAPPARPPGPSARPSAPPRPARPRRATDAVALVEAGSPALLLKPTEEGRSCLHVACHAGHLAIVEALVEASGDSRAALLRKTDGVLGYSCLHAARRYGHPAVVAALLNFRPHAKPGPARGPGGGGDPWPGAWDPQAAPGQQPSGGEGGVGEETESEGRQGSSPSLRGRPLRAPGLADPETRSHSLSE